MPNNDQMLNADLWQYVQRHKQKIESALADNLPLAPRSIETSFNEAVTYSAFPGGKRLRPIMTLLGAELFGGKPEDVLQAACAVEFIHTSSLIFDDAPGMDNSPERRGKESLHQKFGEGLSTLVAIGFLNQSYALVARDAGGDRQRTSDSILEIVNCVGPAGMIGGQSVDLKLREVIECKVCSGKIVGGVLNLKTSSLIRLSLRLGAILAGADSNYLDSLSQFAELLGQAYQISDDLLDVEEDVSVAGVPYSVKIKGSPTQRLSDAVGKAKDILTNSFVPSEARLCLSQLVDYVSIRED